MRYPDFTIRKRDGNGIFWEHAGMLSYSDYMDSFFAKIALYHINGISIGNNLIVTANKEDGSMDSAIVSRIAEYLSTVV